jgi:D-arabinose 1-dehydrogenase-like Zn-dependent alcohol dehydrogenase
MSTQRALLVREIGKPLVLVHDRPIPKAGHGQVQIKVTVAGKSETCRLMIAPLIFGS